MEIKKMKKHQEIVLFDNTDYSERYNDIREELYHSVCVDAAQPRT